MVEKCKKHWLRISIRRKLVEVFCLLLLLFSTVPANAVRFSILMDAEPKVAFNCKPKYEQDFQDSDSWFVNLFYPVYNILPYKYMRNANFEVTQFQVIRLGIFNIAWPKIPMA